MNELVQSSFSKSHNFEVGTTGLCFRDLQKLCFLSSDSPLPQTNTEDTVVCIFANWRSQGFL